MFKWARKQYLAISGIFYEKYQKSLKSPEKHKKIRHHQVSGSFGIVIEVIYSNFADADNQLCSEVPGFLFFPLPGELSGIQH